MRISEIKHKTADKTKVELFLDILMPLAFGSEHYEPRKLF